MGSLQSSASSNVERGGVHDIAANKSGSQKDLPDIMPWKDIEVALAMSAVMADGTPFSHHLSAMILDFVPHGISKSGGRPPIACKIRLIQLNPC